MTKDQSYFDRCTLKERTQYFMTVCEGYDTARHEVLGVDIVTAVDVEKLREMTFPEMLRFVNRLSIVRWIRWWVERANDREV